jgi:hypothetical protein
MYKVQVCDEPGVKQQMLKLGYGFSSFFKWFAVSCKQQIFQHLFICEYHRNLHNLTLNTKTDSNYSKTQNHIKTKQTFWIAI